MDYAAREKDYENYLQHYGMPRRSGRYPWGSGENPYQSEDDFLARIQHLESLGLDEDQIAKDMKMTKSQVQTQRTMSKAGKLYAQGKSETEVARELGLSTSQLRTQISLANSDRRGIMVSKIHALQKKGYSGRAIAKELGYDHDSSIRALLDEDAKAHSEAARSTADFLKKQVEEKGMIDVGTGIEKELGISKEKLDQALYILDLEEGYKTYGGGIKQMTNRNQQTNQRVLCDREHTNKDIYNFKNVKTINDYSYHSETDSYEPKFVFPKSMDSSRIKVVWPEEGGDLKDGLVQLRPGIEDLSLGNSNYAQVRILVDYDKKKQKGYYVKGMAVYGDPKDFPDGVDVLVNTGKDPKKDAIFGRVLKECKTIKQKDGTEVIDMDNPFGALIKEGVNQPDDSPKDGGQSYYIDKNGKKQLSLINKKNDQGDWAAWSDKLPSQFLAKQPEKLIDKQLRLSEADMADEYESIMSLTNPTIKSMLLSDFAETCDKKASDLSASKLPGQKYFAILPLENLKEGECYCPNYENGTKLALVRYPHGGTFEIPVVTVNNNNKKGKDMIGPLSIDAIGITKKDASQLSGADFDGDTVMAIPITDKVKISARKSLPGLEGFDDQQAYPYKEGIRVMQKKEVQKEMGSISNLIMDMTIQGADDEELAAAVRHSMVVIDANKHKLDYKQSEKDNNIQALKDKYQGKFNEETGHMNYGASTLLTRAKSEARLPERKEGAWVSPDGTVRESEQDHQPGDRRLMFDPKTGKRLYSVTNRTYTEYTFTDPDTGNKVKSPLFTVDSDTGKRIYANENGNPYIITTKDGKQAQTKSTKMDAVEDAHELSRGTVKEEMYADYANYLKALANQARVSSIEVGKLQYSPQAKKVYAEQVEELKNALAISEANTPKEREAQRLANYTYSLIEQDNPGMSTADQKKARQRCLVKARDTVGAKRVPINITEKQWEAIQAGAISNAMLTSILKYADKDKVRELAMPKETNRLTESKKNRIDAMAANGYTIEQIASQIGFSTSTVSRYLNEGK